MVKKLFLSALVIMFLAVGFNNVSASDKITYTGPPIQIRFSIHVPATHLIWKKLILPWTKLVEEESQGKLVIKSYLGGVLHAPRAGFKAVRGEVTDIAMAYPMWEPGGFHLNFVFALPFAFPSAGVSALVAEELYPKYLKEEYERKGIYLAWYSSIPPYNLMSKKPVRTLEDLKGMKIRSPAGPMAEMAKKLGAVPVFMSIAEVYTALQRGMIDGVFTPDFGGYAYKFYELAKYLTELKIATSANPYGLNRKAYDGLPDDLKKLFYNLLRRQSQLSSTTFDEQNEQSRNGLVEKGVKVINLTPQEQKRWKTAVEPLWEEFIEKNEALGLPAKQLVDDMRKLSKKYSLMTPGQRMKKVMEYPVQGIID